MKMKEMKKNWSFYTDWLQSKLPQYAKLLNSGTSDDVIAKLETYLQLSLPEEVKELYRMNDGDNSSNVEDVYVGTFLAFEFLSIERIIEVHNDWKQFNNLFDDQEYSGSSFPEGAIKIQYTNEKWIPIFKDGASNYIGIDLDPDANGTKGQIINFGRDEDDKFVIANNLNSFLEYIKTKIQSGECDEAIIEEGVDEYGYGLKPESHLIDDLRKEFGQ